MYKFFLVYFGDLEDKREVNKVEHDLFEIVFMSFIGILCGVDGFVGLSNFATYQKDWFLKYIKLENGVPSHDTFRTVLNMLDPKDFSDRFALLFKEIIKFSGKNKKEDHLQVDGKSIKGSQYIDKETSKKKIIHTVNVLSQEYGLTICQRTVDGNKYTSENSAILEILSMLHLKKKTISVDAGMSYKNIAIEIRKKLADYVFAIKGNNPNALQSLREEFMRISNKEEYQYVEDDSKHGRNTRRVFYSYRMRKSLRELVGFQDVKYFGVYESHNTDTGELNDRRYFITSRNIRSPKEFYRLCRNHWGVENKLHWMLDVLFNEDNSKIKKGNAPKILLILRQLGLNLLKMDKSKGSFKGKKDRFAWDYDYRNEMLMQDVAGWILN